MAQSYKDFSEIIYGYRYRSETHGHEAANDGEDNIAFQIGEILAMGKKNISYITGDFNRTAQQGSDEYSGVEGHRNGTVQFGAENIATTNGQQNLTRQRGVGNNSNITRNHYSTLMLGVGHNHDSKRNTTGPTFDAGNIQECQRQFRDRPWVLKWVDTWGWAWDLACKWAGNARNFVK
ncbi:hypothetical protein F4814DRAFT_457736 [Daldinia grandis]|nr:hypothetical protein F4814DRAFT_457736 [Daldinia grandis]